MSQMFSFPVDGGVGDQSEMFGERIGSIHDPSLRGLLEELRGTVNGAESALLQLPALETRRDPSAQLFDQDYVDGVVGEFVGQEKLDSARQVVDAFTEVSRPMVINSLPSNVLTGCIGTMIWANPPSRETGRKLRGSSLAQSRRLLSFYDDTGIGLAPGDAQAVWAALFDPLAAMTEERSKAFKGDPVRAEALIESISAQERFDPSTRLDLVRCLVFGGILEVYKSPEVAEVLRQVSRKSDAPEINDSGYGPHYYAAQLIADLKREKEEGLRDEVTMLRSMHSQRRLLGIPSRKFKEAMSDLTALGNLYIGLDMVENELRDLPESVKDTEGALRILLRAQATDIVDEVLKKHIKVYDDMAAIQNGKLAEDTEAGERVWWEAIEFDDIRIEFARSLFKLLGSTGTEVNPKIRQMLEDECQPKARTQFDQFVQRSEDEERYRAAEALASEILDIDNHYRLPNKRLRERVPELIGLAKTLSDSLLNGNNPITEEDARRLVGLMLGVYWERTGEVSTMQARAARYLEDASIIRNLSAELNTLGFDEESKLLKTINLLDELIDSGLFDKRVKNPELEVFDDFILGYMIAKDEENRTLSQVDAPAPGGTSVVETDEGSMAAALEVLTKAKAEYQDLRVFPPGSTAEEVISDYKDGITDKDLPLIEWERIVRLIDLRDLLTRQKLEATLIRTKHASWQVLPFFVLEVKLPGRDHAVAVVESPVYGNATYIYREAANRESWRDVVQLERQDARELGAVPAVHVDSKKLDLHFRKIWDRVISELTVAQ